MSVASLPPVPCIDALATNEPAPAAVYPAVPLTRLTKARIVRVEVSGNASVPRALVDDAIRTRTGAKLDRATIQADIRRLWGLEVFADVRVTASKHRRGITLRYELTPRRLIGRIFIAGATAQVRGWQRIRLLAGSVYDAARLHRYARDQIRRYAAAGFLDADVRVTERAGNKGAIDVCFAAAPGPKYTIDRIEIDGNRAISDDAIRDALRGARGEVNAAGGRYDEARFAHRMQLVTGLYFEQGMVAVRVGPPRVVRDARRGRIRIRLPVTEGAVYRVGRLRIEGAGSERRVYMQHIRVKTGDVFRRSVVMRATAKLVELAKKRSGKHATILTSIDAKRRAVDIEFRLTRGAR